MNSKVVGFLIQIITVNYILIAYKIGMFLSSC